MARIASVLFLLVLVNVSLASGKATLKSYSSHSLTHSVSDYVSFTEGFIYGAQTDRDDDSQCLIDFEAFSGNLTVIQNDVETIMNGDVIQGFYHLSVDINNILEERIPELSEECNVSGLVNALNEVFLPGGLLQIMSNYDKNRDDINRYINSLVSCGDDYYQCGNELGKIVRLITGWSINSSY